MGDQTLLLHFSAAKLRIAILCFSLFSLYLFISQYLAVLFIGVLWCKLFYLTSQARGPFYPVLTGRRDNIYSYFNKALAEFPWLDNNIIKTLPLFDRKRFWWKRNSLSFRYLLVLCLFSFYALVLWNWKGFKCCFGLHQFLDHLKLHSKLGRLDEFIQKHLYDFKRIGQPDPTRASDFLTDMRMRCQDSNRTTTQPSS